MKTSENLSDNQLSKVIRTVRRSCRRTSVEVYTPATLKARTEFFAEYFSLENVVGIFADECTVFCCNVDGVIPALLCQQTNACQFFHQETRDRP